MTDEGLDEAMDEAIAVLMEIPQDRWQEVLEWAQIGQALARRKKENEEGRVGNV